MTRIALLVPVLVAGMANAAPRSEEMVGFRQAVAVGPMKITPLAIVEDSRCPADGMCIWAGRVVLRVAVVGPGIRRTLELESHKAYPIPGGKLKLTRIEPSKPRGKPLKSSAYRFGFAFKPET